MQFSKRLKPLDNEILTGYLMRLAKFNYWSISKTISLISKSQDIHSPNYHRIDIKPDDKIDVKQFSQYTGLDSETIYSMTFKPLEKKFVSSNVITRELLHSFIEFESRRFCPKCIQQYAQKKQTGIYKLIWQIKEFKLCEIHHIPLLSSCKTCGAIQPYVSEGLAEYSCYKCGKKLYHDIAEVEFPQSFIESQRKIFNQWTYLISNKTNGLLHIPEINYEVQMVLTLLYLLNKNNDKITDIPIETMDRTQVTNALAFIKYAQENYYLTPSMLFKYLGKTKYTIKDFFNTEIPKDFIDKLIQYLGINYEQLCNSGRKSTNKRMFNKVKPPKKDLRKKATAEKVEAAANYLLTHGQSLTYKNIAQKVGVSVQTIKNRYDLIEIINRIKQERGQ